MKTRSTINKKVQITWYGHSAFAIESPDGKVILIDPWLENPCAPKGAKDIPRADIILISHGHSDHVGNTIEVTSRTNAKVICIYELSLFLQSNGVLNIQGMNKGGTICIDGISITMVDAKHSSDIDADGNIVPGGEAAGFVIKLENGPTLYHAGDTALFGDMKLIGKLYKPDIAMVPIGDLYTMGPRDAAFACTLVKPRHIIGMHYGTFPALTGTPSALRKHLPAAMKKRLLELQPGVTIALK